nr:MAG TPA: hypothetical protein [Caudoviricetes sp.]
MLKVMTIYNQQPRSSCRIRFRDYPGRGSR